MRRTIGILPLLLAACLNGTEPVQSTAVVRDGAVLAVTSWNRSQYNCGPSADLLHHRDPAVCGDLDSVVTLALDSIALRMTVHADSRHGSVEYLRGVLTGDAQSCAYLPEQRCRTTPINQVVSIQRYPMCMADAPDAAPTCQYWVSFSIAVSYRSVDGPSRSAANRFTRVESDGRLRDDMPNGFAVVPSATVPMIRSWDESGWAVRPEP